MLQTPRCCHLPKMTDACFKSLEINLMIQATYQTRLPDELVPFAERMSLLMSDVERHLYQDLKAGRALKDLKREDQLRFGINARQFNSVHSVLKGKIRSRKECHKLQIKELKSRLSDLKKRIKLFDPRPITFYRFLGTVLIASEAMICASKWFEKAQQV